MKGPSSIESSFILTKYISPFITTSEATLKAGDSTTIFVNSTSKFTRHDALKVGYSLESIQSVDGGALAPFDSLEVYNWSSLSTAVEGSNNATARINTNAPHPVTTEEEQGTCAI
jgi:hypothetical protein